MKAIKIIGNIFGVLIALVLSIVLFVMLLVTPIITSVTLITKPEAIHEVITQPEVVEMITEIPAVSESLEAAGMDGEFVQQVTQSQFFEDFVHLYTNQTVGGVTGEVTGQVSVEQVQQIIEDNKEEVVDMVRPLAEKMTEGENVPTDDEIEEIIDYAVENYGQDFLDSLPSGQELMDLLNSYSGDMSGLIGDYGSAAGLTNGFGAPVKMSLGTSGPSIPSIEQIDVDALIATAVKLVLDGTLTRALIAVIVLLSVLILIFRWPRFKGLMWVSIVFLCGGGALFGVCEALSVNSISQMILELLDMQYVGAAILGLIINHIRTYAIAFLIVGGACLVVFIIARIILNAIKKNRKKKLEAVNAANIVDAEPVVEEIPAVEAPAEEAPVEESEAEVEVAEEPVEEAPAEEAPAEDAPVEEAPAEETTEEIVTAE